MGSLLFSAAEMRSDTIFYVYAVTDRAARGPLRVRGLAREPLRFVRCGPVTAVVGECAARPPIDERHLRAHAAAVRRLGRVLDPLLPARYGGVVRDRCALVDALAPRGRALRRALREVRGREQMTLRFPGAAPPPRAPAGGARGPGAGTRHLEALRAHRAAVPPELEALRPSLARLVRGERIEPASVHHLIERGAGKAYAAAVARALGPRRAGHVLVFGPSPCWAFAPEES